MAAGHPIPVAARDAQGGREVNPPRVLVVEDSRTVRAALVEALTGAGFEAVAVTDATEALDALAHRRFNLVLADYQLPGMNGLNLLAALRGTDADFPLILYSGSMTPELAAQARDFGVSAVLEKPISLERLVAAVRAALPAGAGDPRR
jgi:CheY-like chemotaxis protein